MDYQLLLVILLLLSIKQAKGQYSCSNRPDGRCTRCDCVPDCFDLSDETNCTNYTSIQRFLRPQYLTMVLPKGDDVGTNSRFFPPPPLPPFPLCSDFPSTSPALTRSVTPIPTTTPTSMDTQTRHTGTQSNGHPGTLPTPTSSTQLTRQDGTQQTTQESTESTNQFGTQSTKRANPPTTPNYVTVPSTVWTTITATKGWVTQRPRYTLSRRLCGEFIREYYTRCRFAITNYCHYLVMALRLCTREATSTSTTTTTTTTLPPTIFPPYTHPPDYPFDYFNFDYIFL